MSMTFAQLAALRAEARTPEGQRRAVEAYQARQVEAKKVLEERVAFERTLADELAALRQTLDAAVVSEDRDAYAAAYGRWVALRAFVDDRAEELARQRRRPRANPWP